ncbi:hypothetical protein C8F01DRAFT_1234314 [Mycena amicta]|nr:hypothetical protein C8F01DRAFT_1234314 [Mycena amicta]
MTSPFSSKLNTNYCPSEAECADIKAFLVEPTIRLRRLDAVIRQLTEERDKLAAEVAAHEALISPMRRMPNEILQEIFVACLPSDRNPAMSASEAPVLLGRICGAWRDLALATPRLWAKIHIVEPSLSLDQRHANAGLLEAKVEQRLQALQSWLTRSGECPLSISFVGHRDAGTNPLFIQRLVTFVRRWREIHFFVVRDQMLLQELQELTPFQLTNLRRFGQLGTSPLFSAPLSSLSLRNWAAETSVDVLPLQWDKLTDLELDDRFHGAVSQRSIVEILAKCRNLQTCHLLLARQPEFAPDLSQPLIECAALDSLMLYGTTSFLGCLSCPVLRRLKLRSDSMNVDARPITHVITSSRTHLHHVALEIDFHPDFLLELIRSKFGAGGRFVDELLMDLADDGCCPQLEQLILRNCDSISDAGIVRFLRARGESSHSLRRVRVEFKQPAHDEEDIPGLLLPFLEAGVDTRSTGGAHMFRRYNRLASMVQLAHPDALHRACGIVYSSPSKVGEPRVANEGASCIRAVERPVDLVRETRREILANVVEEPEFGADAGKVFVRADVEVACNGDERTAAGRWAWEFRGNWGCRRGPGTHEGDEEEI